MVVEKKKDLLRKEGMHAGASAEKYAFAQMLRESQTPQEEKLWVFLKTKPKGYKFRRQHPFGDYVLDFYCHKAKLVIELDGNQHKSNREYDDDRTKFISNYGLKVIRFDNIEIDENFDGVVKNIVKYLDNFPSL